MMRKSSNSQELFSPDGGQDSSMGSQIVILRVFEESKLEMDSDNLITKQTLKICRYWDPIFFELDWNNLDQTRIFVNQKLYRHLL